MNARFRLTLLFSVLLGFPPSDTRVQAASQNAALYGTVYDAMDKPMAGVTVTLHNPTLGFLRTTTTASDGTFSFAEVPPGEGYWITAAKGSKMLDIRKGLTLQANDERVILPPLKEQAAAAQAHWPLSFEDVEKLLEGGVTNARVSKIVKEYGVDFDLTPDREQRLRAAGADDDLLSLIGPPTAVANVETKPVPQVTQLSLITQPGGVQVYVDERFKGITSEQAGTLVIEGLAPGSHQLRLTLPGYKEWSQQITLAAGETLPVSAKLEAAGPKPLAFEEVEEVVKNYPKKQAMKSIKQFGVDFAMTAERETRLRAAGADGELLYLITQSKK